MESSICVLGSGPTAAEAMKNMVLPGCGKITVIDDAEVLPRDVGNNFFVSAAAVGQARGKVVVDNLVEMNDDVSGCYEEGSPAEYMSREDLSWADKHDLVIVTDCPMHQVARLADHVYSHGNCLVIARTYGLLGHVRVVCREHCIVESKPENRVRDLRLGTPFPALKEFAERFDVDTLPDHLHGHVPYVVLLMRCMWKWEAEHEGKQPSTFAEKQAFKAQVQGLARGQYGDEENVVEATERAYEAYASPDTDAVMDVIRDSCADVGSLRPGVPKFWVLMAALRRFVDGEGGGHLPVSGTLPDMTATTEWYIELQRMYAGKAAGDRAAVTAHVAAILSEAGLGDDYVSSEDIAHVCLHALDIRIVRGRSLAAELACDEAHREACSMGCMVSEHGEQCPLGWYVGLRGADEWYKEHGDWPGNGEGWEEDAEALMPIMTTLAEKGGVDGAMVTRKHALEICRYGGVTPHAVASTVGGVVGQEAIKLLTRQYTPLRNTWLFNGIKGASEVHEL
jgi:amyloid beta precursor protein binding protein 1